MPEIPEENDKFSALPDDPGFAPEGDFDSDPEPDSIPINVQQSQFVNNYELEQNSEMADSICFLTQKNYNKEDIDQDFNYNGFGDAPMSQYSQFESQKKG